MLFAHNTAVGFHRFVELNLFVSVVFFQCWLGCQVLNKYNNQSTFEKNSKSLLIIFRFFSLHCKSISFFLVPLPSGRVSHTQLSAMPILPKNSLQHHVLLVATTATWSARVCLRLCFWEEYFYNLQIYVHSIIYIGYLFFHNFEYGCTLEL